MFMRILILTHPRSGGSTFLAWISSELEIQSCQEPIMNPNVPDDVWNPQMYPNVCIKEHIHRFTDAGLDIQEIINGFDKVIFHTRRDLEEAAISRAKQAESGESNLVYHMDPEWKETHSGQILSARREISDFRDSISFQQSLCEVEHISTTYCGIYREFTDIPIILKFLAISDPHWLDIIHPKRRLQNGDLSLSPPRKKAKLI